MSLQEHFHLSTLNATAALRQQIKLKMYYLLYSSNVQDMQFRNMQKPRYGPLNAQVKYVTFSARVCSPLLVCMWYLLQYLH